MSDFVADIGNTRVKWGECAPDGLSRATALPPDDLAAWAKQFAEWNIPNTSRWTLAGTNPERLNTLARWLNNQGCKVGLVDDYRQLPLKVAVDRPETVGLDRLLNAVALLPRVPQGTPLVVVDAGSAVTVDIFDAEGAFRGGPILPGYRLMAKALNDYTARLPFVGPFTEPEPVFPGANTVESITAGISYMMRGGIDLMVQRLSRQFGSPRVFVTGGDAHLLANLDCRPEVAGPYLTLEGIRLVARNLS